MRFSLLTAIILCVIVGVLGGILCMKLVQASFVTGVLLGGLYAGCQVDSPIFLMPL